MRESSHEVSVESTAFEPLRGWVPCAPYVCVSNESDARYRLRLVSAEDVDEFIAELQAAKHYAFGTSSKPAPSPLPGVLTRHFQQSQLQSTYVTRSTAFRVTYVGLDNVCYTT